MSVYNLNNLIGKNKIQVLKKYLHTDKVTVCYSDWLNIFGVRTYKKDVDKIKHAIAEQYVTKYLKDIPISILTKYPKININKKH